VIINFSNTRFASYNLTGMPYDGGWTLRYNSDWKGTYVDWEKKFGSPSPYPGAVNSVSGTSGAGTMPIEIGPYTVLVYSRN
jgi:hypothetical protein